MEHLMSASLALIGVAIATIVSFLVSKATTKTQMSALRFETKRAYETKLVKARLEVYPEIYEILSGFIKRCHKEPITPQLLTEFLQRIDAWDSKHAILFSRETADICYNYRSMLHKILTNSEQEVLKLFEDYPKIRIFRNDTASLELALKSDLGIYGIETSENEGFGLKFVGSVTEVASKVEDRKRIGASFYNPPNENS